MKDITFIIEERKLYTEKVLAEFEIPLLFICKDKSNNRYSVLCVDSDEERYIIVESRISDIVNMIQNTITMKELFLKPNNNNAWTITAGETPEDDVVKKVSIKSIDNEDLPADGAFYEVYNADIHDYVDLLLNRVPKNETVEHVTIINTLISKELMEKVVEQRQFLDFKIKGGAVNEQSFSKILCNPQC